MISVVGYGSLLSEKSARETVPNLHNFRLVTVHGYKRIFNKVGIVFLSRYGASPDALDIASCSTLPDKSVSIICSQFECSEEEYRALIEREHRFTWVSVETCELESTEFSSGLMCTTASDEWYKTQKCISSSDYENRVGRYYQGAIWRNDIFPYPRYLQFCLRSAAEQGQTVLDNFLDSSFLADGQTSLRSYLQSAPELALFLSASGSYSYK